MLPASLLEFVETGEKSKDGESSWVEATYMNEQVVVQKLRSYGWHINGQGQGC